MPYKYLLVNSEDAISTITLNRPKSLNAFCRDMWLELKQALDEAVANDTVRVIVLTGTGRAFSAGMDVKDAKNFTNSEHESYIKLEYALCAYVEDLSKPVIGAINGYALGNGCELALACDIRLATPNAMFGYPEAPLGVTSPAQRLTLLAGMARAKEILFTGRNINAAEAERIGLVNKVVPTSEELLAETKRLAQEIITNTSPIGLKFTKRAIHLGMPLSDAAIAFENQSGIIALNSEDAKEGFSAFLAKRKPVFKGK